MMQTQPKWLDKCCESSFVIIRERECTLLLLINLQEPSLLPSSSSFLLWTYSGLCTHSTPVPTECELHACSISFLLGLVLGRKGKSHTNLIALPWVVRDTVTEKSKSEQFILYKTPRLLSFW